MKKTVLLLVALFGFMSVSFGQATGLKAVKKAARALSTYNLDPVANADKLVKAKDFIETAFESDEVASSTKAFIAKANIYSTIANNTINKSISKKSIEGDDLTLASKAFDAYKKAYELAEKKFEKKDVIKGLVTLEPVLENMGIIAYQEKQWGDAWTSFNQALSASEFLTELGAPTVVTEEKKTDIVINALSVGSQEGSGVDIKGLLVQAIDMDIKNAAIYQIAYTTFLDSDKAKAVEYLNMGREKFSDDAGLLFAEINLFIEEGKLEQLIEKLKSAIAAEPKNASVYSTLGNVYDQLYTKSNEEGGDLTKSEEYFDGAKSYYTQATELDAESFNSYYGIGALYFNKAAKVGKEMNDLPYSEVEKYKVLKEQMDGYYKESYPFLEAAEKLKPNDGLILAALKEYYVRTGDLEKSSEYKAKMEAQQKE